MSDETKGGWRNVAIVMLVYVLLCAFLALGSYLFAALPENEAPGGIVLGLTSLVLGIIIPFHLRRAGVVDFRFLPLTKRAGKVIVGTVLFGLFFLLLFPAGILWQGTTTAFFANPPPVIEALSTFQAMLLGYCCIWLCLLGWHAARLEECLWQCRCRACHECAVLRLSLCYVRSGSANGRVSAQDARGRSDTCRLHPLGKECISHIDRPSIGPVLPFRYARGQSICRGPRSLHSQLDHAVDSLWDL